MKLCIPTLDSAGIGSTISPHFGGANFLILIDSETRAVEAVANTGCEHGSCSALDAIVDMAVDAVICRDIGRNAFSRLARRGVRTFTTDAEDVRGAVAGLLSGDSEALTVGTCEGSHRGGCRH
jgi:predicted Fe-Mo cluster-binding NifX family protein